MSITIEPLHPVFAAEVRGLDVRGPLADDVFEQIQSAFARYAVLVFREQDITDAEQVAFSRRFGPLEPLENYSGKPLRLKEQVADLSNLDTDGKVWDRGDIKRMFNMANMLWHTDSSFKQVPALCSLLSAREIPPVGGETEFTDLRAAYEALPAARQQAIRELVVEHDIFHSRAQVGFTNPAPELRRRLPPVHQRLVRTHVPSGRTTLYLASHATHVVGWPPAEGRALLDELMAFATEPRFVYRHQWQRHDLVMWDNRCTMHRGREYDDLRYKRDMHRTTISEHANTLEQEPLAAAGAQA